MGGKDRKDQIRLIPSKAQESEPGTSYIVTSHSAHTSHCIKSGVRAKRHRFSSYYFKSFRALRPPFALFEVESQRDSVVLQRHMANASPLHGDLLATSIEAMRNIDAEHVTMSYYSSTRAESYSSAIS